MKKPNLGDVMALSNRIAQALQRQFDVCEHKNNEHRTVNLVEEHLLTQVVAVEVKEYFGLDSMRGK